ncbi:MAG: GxxExxY protein [Planctomycetota bacterium]|nr:GxxExxY protein [Planctomycetota bacterium]MDA1163382.1 GxxExxY protein [Planctomycetota bacterium]
MSENELSHLIIGAAIEVHCELGGPGKLEELYEEALCCELQLRGLEIERQVAIPVLYKGRKLSKSYRLDLLVGRLVIVECKATESDNALYQAQCLTQLRLTGLKLGLVINFGNKFLKDGIHRVVNGLEG